jgi:hypothetical protein
MSRRKELLLDLGKGRPAVTHGAGTAFLKSGFTLFLDTPARPAAPGRADYAESTELIRKKRKGIRFVRGIRVQE